MHPSDGGDNEAESLDAWGFADSAFTWGPDGAVQMSGSRYPMSGQALPNLASWVEQTMDIRIDRSAALTSHYPPKLTEPHLQPELLAALRQHFAADQLDSEPRSRLRHGHGHTQAEMYAIKHGAVGRMPDLVVYPQDEEQVVRLVALAQQHDVCLIPYGGGTNVSEALRCRADETRSILSVDLRRLQRILWVDPVNRLACVEAGIVGRHLAAQLKERGFTLGHEPDSVEFSTLGGWIATHASGMKKNRYGNIEDIVLDMRVVTAQGVMYRESKRVAPRESTGMDARRALFGSEGAFGIITAAVIKLFPLPEVQRYGSVLFPNFDKGVACLYALQQSGILPASVRLVDNLQFQFGMALKPGNFGVKKLRSAVEKLWVTRIKGFAADQMTALTLVFEGSRRSVAVEEEVVYRLAKQFGGIKAGAENGKRGYQLTYSIAYIRDFVMQNQIIAESLETSVPWSRALELCQRVKDRLRREHAQRRLPGKPFITCRISQLYDTGVCIYFYFGFFSQGVAEPSRVYNDIEHAARQEILDAGGSLSHHHGVGKLRQDFVPQVMSPATMQWSHSAKLAFDPHNLFASGNCPVPKAAPAAGPAPLP